ncbi:MAG: hypothetical protein O3A85_04415 [Proteobacteria bacterium]|nr:hypothetical protein [Pseudomonadota bacterium]
MDKKTELTLEIWRETISVQKHFNELEIKIRGLAITVLGALLGAVGFSLKEDLNFKLWDQEIRIAVFLLAVALIVWVAFYLMDRLWYHRLLYGAVRHGIKVENALKSKLPEIDLSTTIGEWSPIKIFSCKIHSTNKIDIFYGLVAASIVAFIFAIY